MQVFFSEVNLLVVVCPPGRMGLALTAPGTRLCWLAAQVAASGARGERPVARDGRGVHCVAWLVMDTNVDTIRYPHSNWWPCSFGQFATLNMGCWGMVLAWAFVFDQHPVMECRWELLPGDLVSRDQLKLSDLSGSLNLSELQWKKQMSRDAQCPPVVIHPSHQVLKGWNGWRGQVYQSLSSSSKVSAASCRRYRTAQLLCCPATLLDIYLRLWFSHAAGPQNWVTWCNLNQDTKNDKARPQPLTVLLAPW